MTHPATPSEPGPLHLGTDVLIIGGGLAGTWAALGAARAGASVILVDKGYCGTSGVTASAGPGHWWVPPEARDDAVQRRAEAGQGPADPRWMHRVIDTTWQHLPTVASHYAFPRDEHGRTVIHRGLRGPEYLRAMRQLVIEAGVRILDHSPVLELLLHDDGSVAGASGLRRQLHQPWTIRAGATVLATGGCAFLSKLLGADTNTGDGYLLAAEAGAELSGMEFTNYYTVAPAFSSMTRAMSYVFASYFDEAGRPLDIPPGPASTVALARALIAGPVHCHLGRMPEDLRAHLPTISPNVMLPFTRRGIDPFTDRFPITLRGEGTVRGIGGLRIASDECETTVANLFAAGDAASRELIAGAISGGGAQNSAWALSSGLYAGRGAARRARLAGQRAADRAWPIGETGLRPRQHASSIDGLATLKALQAPMLDLDQNLFRHGARMQRSLDQLNVLWREWRDHAQGQGGDLVRTRETAAMLATARWSLGSALARNESRGMHQRVDAPQADPAQAHRLTVDGLDELRTRPQQQPVIEEALT